MKVGLSTYSLSRAILSGEMDVIQAIEWIAENGGEHVEVVPSGFSLTENPELIEKIVQKASEKGLDISSYTIGANFIQESEEEYRAEIERLKKEVEIGAALGVKLMRHDAASRPIPETSEEQFMKDLPKIADACREIADHAAQYGITTSVENHGHHVQHSARVRKLIETVNRDNYKTTLDIGNFVCVDENPLEAARKNAHLASMVHAKDFYMRDKSLDPGEGFAKTAGGNFRRGAIVGHGDVDVRGAFKVLKEVGYDGYISIEFEGMEECKLGARIGMQNVKRFWSEV
jgi:sugar phosphate isomerase/epimerase